MDEAGGDEAEEAKGTDDKKGLPAAEKLGEPAAEERSDEGTGYLAGEEHTQRPAGFVLGCFLGYERDDGAEEAAHGSLYEAQCRHLPDILCQPHADHDDAEPEARAQRHWLAAVAVRQAAPDGRGDGEADEIGAENDAGPTGNISLAGNADLGNIKRQDRRHLAHADGNDEAGEAADGEVLFPMFHKDSLH